ncbi:hypothetical protein AB0399_15675 [Streptomyces sp. NPDC088194]|uniref:hypothetical protein n=1 Tax=Streptomyces sp. NPDC088194 TaxID=3154931 RepID=UPI003450EAA1
MDAFERLALASQSPSPGIVRPHTETFLARVFDGLGFASTAVPATGAGSSSAGPRQVDSQEGFSQEVSFPPGREELLDELQALLPATTREDGGRLRRIAEIVEVLDGEEAAQAWWCHAAWAGDEVAVAIAEELQLHIQGERPSVLPSITSPGSSDEEGLI